MQTLSFTVAAVPADAAKVKMTGGAVMAKIAEAAAGAGDLATTITPAAQFTNVVLFIDSNQSAVQKTAETKWSWGNNNGVYGAGNNSAPQLCQFLPCCFWFVLSIQSTPSLWHSGDVVIRLF